jgi:hypothetical protein
MIVPHGQLLSKAAAIRFIQSLLCGHPVVATQTTILLLPEPVSVPLLLLLQGLRMLNAVGYGQPGSGLVLDLVYNPGGAFLAPAQAKLQPAYKQELAEVKLILLSVFCTVLLCCCWVRMYCCCVVC